MKNRLAETRQQKHITQKALAQAACMSEKYLQRIEYNQCTPNVGLALRLASSLGVKVEDIFSTPDSSNTA